jgi:peptidoglycan hydrolase CwlO-like protein
MKKPHPHPVKSRTPEEILIWLIDHIIEMELHMASIDENIVLLKQADAQAKDRSAELAAAKQKIADLEAAAVASATALATAQANALTPDQATALDTAAAALVTDTAPATP